MLKNYVLDIGLGHEVNILHASDTHLTCCDERDNERKNLLAQKRSKVFPTNEKDFDEMISLSNELKLPLIHTGDLIDFVSEKNLDKAREFSDSCDNFVCAGNHEFSLYVGEAWEDADYRNQSLEKVQKSFNNNIRFDSRIIDGVNFVAIDNSYYLFDEWQLDALKKEAGKGLPIVLMLHDPIFEKGYYDFLMDGTRPCAYLVAAPEEFMKVYPENRYRQQKADKPTLQTVEYIETSGKISAILAGHMHTDYECTIKGNIPQIVTGIGTVRKITIK